MEQEYVTLKHLAQELKMDRSRLRRYVLSAGFTPLKIRTLESKGQLTLALLPEDAEAIRELREKQGYLCGNPIVVENGQGYFYIIQLVPELEPTRIKLGFASDVQARLGAHKTSAPTAQLLQAWSSKKTWELSAIDSITRLECTPLSGEVFICASLETLIARAEQFFSIMPQYD